MLVFLRLIGSIPLLRCLSTHWTQQPIESWWMYIAALSIVLCLAFLFYEAKTRPAQATPPTTSSGARLEIDLGWFPLSRSKFLVVGIIVGERIQRQMRSMKMDMRVTFLTLNRQK